MATRTAGGVERHLRELIGRVGPIPYGTYMAAALGYPQGGYYRAGREPGEDFLTVPEMSPLLGKLVGRLVGRLASELGPPVVVLEPGAGSGSLASAAAAAMAAECFAQRGPWVAIDLGYARRPPAVAGGYRALGADGLSAVRPLDTGVVVANEFIDALPCDLYAFHGGRWRSLMVATEGDRFVEVPGEEAGADELEVLAAVDEPREETRMEIRPAAGRLLADMARVVRRGFALFLDYGGSTGELAGGGHGTLRTFHRQGVLGDPLAGPGRSDLTADVDFTDLARRGRKAGWTTVLYTTQGRLLRSLGLLEELAVLSGDVATPEKLNRYLAAKRLLPPEGMQSRFKCLLLARGLNEEPASLACRLGLDSRGERP